MRYDWPQGSPYPADAPGSINPYVEFPCPLPRPKLNGMRMRLTGHDAAGASYHVAFSHAGGCRWRTMKWKLRDEFFGIGTYSVTGQLLDSQGKTSRRVTRRTVTND